MSMRDYPVDDYGLLLTKDMMRSIVSKVIDDFEEINEDEYGDALYEEGICEYIGDFTGEAGILFDDGTNNWIKTGEVYDGTHFFKF